MVKRYGLREDQWERIKDFLPGRADTVGVTAKDNRLFKPLYIAIERAFRGEICLNDLGIGKIFIADIVDGRKQASGNKYLTI